MEAIHPMTDNAAHARQILEGTSYMVLATSDAEGHPWASPVWFGHDGLDRLYWLSTGAYTTSYSAVEFNGFPPLKAFYL